MENFLPAEIKKSGIFRSSVTDKQISASSIDNLHLGIFSVKPEIKHAGIGVSAELSSYETAAGLRASPGHHADVSPGTAWGKYKAVAVIINNSLQWHYRGIGIELSIAHLDYAWICLDIRGWIGTRQTWHVCRTLRWIYADICAAGLFLSLQDCLWLCKFQRRFICAFQSFQSRYFCILLQIYEFRSGGYRQNS